MSEKFSLKWNDFNQNVSKTFSSLRHQEDFYDVTLVGDDQKQFSAHRVVLSACSDYFGNVLKKNKHSHPLLCLEGITSSQLNCLLDYVYHGEAQLFQDDLDNFLQIAQRLQLKGLIEDQNSPRSHNDNFKYEEKQYTKPLQQTVDYDTYDIQQTDRKVLTPIDMPNTSALVDLNALDTSNLQEVNQKIEELIEMTEDGQWRCKACGKYQRRKDYMKKHIETHIDGLSFPCSTCGKLFRSRNSLLTHIHKRKCPL